MDKQSYDEMRMREEQEKKKSARNQNMKKYTKTTLWITLIVLVLGGGGWYLVKSGFFAYDPLDICVQHTGVGMHIHPHLKIFVKDEEIKIPANVGISASCMRPIHTHDDTGTLHLEFPNVRDVALGDLFKIWEREFDWSNAKMTVNSKENIEFQNYIMRDEDQIELFFD